MDEWIQPQVLKGQRVLIEEFYGQQLLLRLPDGVLIEIRLEDSGMGYGEGGYTEYMEMQAFKRRNAI